MSKGYIPKDLSFDNEAREKLIKGITKISKAVKSTLGPRGQTVLIESPDHLGGITITKDGVTVAKGIFLDDPVENLSIQMMKDAASRTANVAGDGTTTAIVLTEALIKNGNDLLSDKHSKTEVIRQMQSISKDVISKLEKQSKKIKKNDLGFANKIIVGKASSVIIRHEQMTEEIEQRIKELKEQQSNTSHPEEKKFINERIASLSGAIGCIYVGGNSDVEQKEKFDRVDDSVCAVKSALEEGIVVGGGLALYNIAKELLKTKYKDKNQSLASTILSQSLVAPFEQILTNAGIDPDTIKLTSKQTYGFDVKNEKYGDMFKMGIIDPLKVTKNAFINAVSVATTILSTNAIVTHARINQQK